MNRSLFRFIFSSFLSAGFCLSASAAIPKSVYPASAWIKEQGGLRGGNAGTAFSLLEIKRQSFVKNKSERILVAQGNGASQTLIGSPGYFTVDLKAKKLTIDFAQTLNSKFQAADVRKAFAKSVFVKKADLFFEPQSQTMSLVLDLKSPVQVRAIPVSGKGTQTALVAFELMPLKH
jgi:hypothetical protein